MKQTERKEEGHYNAWMQRRITRKDGHSDACRIRRGPVLLETELDILTVRQAPQARRVTFSGGGMTGKHGERETTRRPP